MITPQQIEEAENFVIAGDKLKDIPYQEMALISKSKKQYIQTLDRYKNKLEVQAIQRQINALHIYLTYKDSKVIRSTGNIKK